MTTPLSLPMNAAEEAGELADLFNDLSQTVDEFRLADHDPPLTPDQLARLKDEAQALENRAQHFTAESIGATLESIQADLANIKNVTAEANAQLGHLNTVADVISIATSVLSLGTAIAAGNPGSIIAAAEALGQTLAAPVTAGAGG
jgi:hypothetical protein